MRKKAQRKEKGMKTKIYKGKHRILIFLVKKKPEPKNQVVNVYEWAVYLQRRDKIFKMHDNVDTRISYQTEIKEP